MIILFQTKVILIVYYQWHSLQIQANYVQIICSFKEFAVTTRFDIFSSWVIKLEWHLMNGLADVDLDPNDLDPELLWMLYAAKLSYNF